MAGKQRKPARTAWAKALSDARVRRRMSILDLVERTELSTTTISKVLHGDDSVLLRHIYTLAGALGVKVDLRVVEGVEAELFHDVLLVSL